MRYLTSQYRLKKRTRLFFPSVTQTRVTNADFSFILLYFFMIARKIILANGQRHIFKLKCKQTFRSEKLEISILECLTEFEDDVK